MNFKAPFPYFGGKSMIAHKVWEYLGHPKRYIEPFFGSGAVLLNRPHYPFKDLRYEIINDKDGFISNVWRAIQFAPQETAKICDWPINHADLSARKRYLCNHEADLLKKLIADPEYFDVKIAGYWIWAASCWIGSGLTRFNAIPVLNQNKGVNSIGQRPDIINNHGVHSICQIPRLSHNIGVNSLDNIYSFFDKLSARLRHVKVVCGDWTQVCGGNWQDIDTSTSGGVGIFFDPPYGVDDRDNKLYNCESKTVSLDVESWCAERGNKPSYKIVIAGYESEYKSLVNAGWKTYQWSANGGYGNTGNGQGNKNRHRETLFISPHCFKNELFDL